MNVQQALAAARELLPAAIKARDWQDTPIAAADAINALDDLVAAIDAQQPWGYVSDRSDWDEYRSRKAFLRASQIKVGKPIPLYLAPSVPAAPAMIVGGMAHDD